MRKEDKTSQIMKNQPISADFLLVTITYFGIFYNRIYNKYNHMQKSIHSKEYQTVLSQLKKARIEADLKQEKVAKILKKPQSYISKIERGERRLDITELKKLADIYKKSVDYFVK